MSDLAPALRTPSHEGSPLSIEEIAQISNAVMPCFLLELGRRRLHIQVEFPLNPAERTACFRFSVAPSDPMRSLSTELLLHLVDACGEALVGLCCFGDQVCRTKIEAELISKDPSVRP